ncbi:MAG: hypothetical protein QM805_26460 [Pseudomonas sp.]
MARDETLLLEGSEAPAMTFWQLDNDGQVGGSDPVPPADGRAQRQCHRSAG